MSSTESVPIDELLRQGTVPVLINGEVKGTAWLVSEEGHLLTAGHLLGERIPLDQVEIRFDGDIPRVAHRIDWAYSPPLGLDYAVLKLDALPAGRRPLPISIARTVDGAFRLCGFGKTLRDRSDGGGEIIGAFDPQNSRANRLLLLRSPELGEGGYSGAAVYSYALRAVVAIQIESTVNQVGAGRDTILAMPIYRIAERWEFLRQIAREAPVKDSTTTTPGAALACSHLGFAGTYNFVTDRDEYDKQPAFVITLVRMGALFYALYIDRVVQMQTEEEIGTHFDQPATDWVGRVVIPPTILLKLLRTYVFGDKPDDEIESASNPRVHYQLRSWYETAKRFTDLTVSLEFPGRHQNATVIITYWNYTPSFVQPSPEISASDATNSARQTSLILMEQLYGDIDNLFSAFVFEVGRFNLPVHELRKLSFVYFCMCSHSVGNVASTFDLFAPLYKKILLASRPESLSSSLLLEKYAVVHTRGFIGMTGQPRIAKTPSLQLVLYQNKADHDDLELVDVLRHLCSIEKVSAQLNTISEYALPELQYRSEQAMAGLRKIRGEARQISVDRDKCSNLTELSTLVERATMIDDELAGNLHQFLDVRSTLSGFHAAAIRGSEFILATKRELRVSALLGGQTFLDERLHQGDDVVRAARSCELALTEGYDSLNALQTSLSGCRLSLYEKHASIQGRTEEESAVRELVFVLMPFRPEFDEIYKEIVAPLIDENNERWVLNCKRADEVYGTNSIIMDIWQWIRKARLIIAELSGRNPNVLYELGLCHMFRKPVILMTQSMEDVPFSLQHLRCIVYKLGPTGLRQLRTDLRLTIDSLLGNNVREVDLFRE